MRQILILTGTLLGLTACAASPHPVQGQVLYGEVNVPDSVASEILRQYLLQRREFTRAVPILQACRGERLKMASRAPGIERLIRDGVIAGIDTLCSVTMISSGDSEATPIQYVGFGVVLQEGDTISIRGRATLGPCSYLDEEGKMWASGFQLRTIKFEKRLGHCGPQLPVPRP
ncbi:MAG: hypothetical protein SFU57_13355 [Gemmatimonadales bacterium]|nr:hypothetical protein [Gemmatimonadales bacterium]